MKCFRKGDRVAINGGEVFGTGRVSGVSSGGKFLTIILDSGHGVGPILAEYCDLVLVNFKPQGA
jgi:hypothetical protein